MKFIDEVTIHVQAGHGGPGCRSFRREKYVPLGGPDGGNGGRGGSIILIADPNKNTLLDFRYRPKWKGEDGDKGRGHNCDGKSGQDLYVHVPVGTQILREGSLELVVDLINPNQEFILAKGGRGGKGNAFFRSATNQAPEVFQPGEPGGEGHFVLSLKLIADVALVGFPNVGKSTLISRISEARPKVADYPFTTLVPNLGVVRAKGDKSFVVADIPGLIAGAHLGKGLGLKFLKHIERTKLIAHLIDLTQTKDDGTLLDPFEAFDCINNELALFSEELSKKPQIIVITKIDAIPDKTPLQKIIQKFHKIGRPLCLAISSASGEGIQALIDTLQKNLEQATPVAEN